MPLPFRILIVDDSSIDRFLLSKMVLKGRFCEISEVADGNAAIAALKNQGYDLVLLDLVMPDISGMDVIRYIRADKRLATTKVLLVTASNNANTLLEARKKETAADGIIIKPYAIVNMISKIDSLLS